MLSRALAAVVLACASFTAASAPVIWISDVSGRIGSVDVASGAVLSSVTVTGIDSPFLTDIAFDATGQLWGTTFTSLYRLNATTGAATFVGNNGIQTLNALAFDPATGVLYAAGSLGSALFALNTTNGAATQVAGESSSTLKSAGDLAFVNGALYLSTSDDYLTNVNVKNPGGSSFIGTGLGISNVFGLAADGGTLYGVSGRDIYIVDPVTGKAAADPLSSYGSALASVSGSAFFAEAGAKLIPTPASALLLALGLAGIGLSRRRRVH